MSHIMSNWEDRKINKKKERKNYKMSIWDLKNWAKPGGRNKTARIKEYKEKRPVSNKNGAGWRQKQLVCAIIHVLFLGYHKRVYFLEKNATPSPHLEQNASECSPCSRRGEGRRGDRFRELIESLSTSSISTSTLQSSAWMRCRPYRITRANWERIAALCLNISR